MNWFIDALKNAFNFSGRARRKAYWMFVLFYVIFAFVAGVLDGILGTTVNPKTGMGVIGGLYIFLMLLPLIALSIRRLHDTDRSGWWFLINFVPLIGGLVFFVFTLLEGTRGDNRFGPDPKAGE
ncbi:DUF805 domain-containing protein [Simonsiella muelleri]|uniref:DUF805 domain-containing protein n=1 Tax=Simonsiella muelleri TaxID=72 RepID=UPI0028D896F9|nr:DUF805 domain-containing protein [Simonsiella muelleri]